MFDNKIFEQWLNKKTDEILSKIDREQITTEEMIILSLKAQTNHFHHMDIEFRDEFKRIDKRFELIDKRFEQVDKRFERIMTILMWGFGTMITCFFGLFFQLLKH